MISAVPTPVGVNRGACAAVGNASRRPHARGGEPKPSNFGMKHPLSRPHARGGEPDSLVLAHIAQQAVPTPVGVNLSADGFPCVT